MIFDTHAHYDDEAFDEDREELLASLADNGIGNVVNVAASMRGCHATLELTERYDFVYGALGVHPDDADGLTEADMDEEAEERLRSMISQKNYFGVEDLVREQGLNAQLSEAFQALPHLFGNHEVLDKARHLTDNHQAIAAVERLEEIYQILKIYGYEKYISFDFGMVSKIQYYTGVIFQAYTYGTGEPIVKGGRYDELLKHFGKPAASIGFVIMIDGLLTALTRQKIVVSQNEAPVVLTYNTSNRKEIIEQAQKLRKEGTCVALRCQKEDC